MILSLFGRAVPAGTISTLYGMIVAQARLSVFYRDYGVPDTVDGRFELVVLHLALLFRRLASETERQLGQGVFDEFCRDMDQNLREIGIGDLKVPREMRRIGEAFYGRAQAYSAGLAGTGDAELIEALARNVYAGPAGEASGVGRLASYMREAAAMLEALPTAALGRGELSFPDPARVQLSRIGAR